MNLYPTILVPLDGSSQSVRVLPYAKRLAHPGGKLVLLDVVPDRALDASAEDVLRSIAEQLTEDEISVETRLEAGDPPTAIVRVAELVGADLIAMATDRWSGLDRWLNDSVADDVLRHTSIPVLLAPAECLPEVWAGDRPPAILVPVDGSPLAEQSLEPAAQFARRFGSEVVLLRAVDDDNASASAQAYLDELAARLSPVQTMTSVAVGSPQDVIRQVAEASDIGLIVMATHGRGGWDRFVHGSIATRTLQHTTVPLVLLHPVEQHSVL